MKTGHHEFVNYRETHRNNLNSEMSIFQTTYLLEEVQNLPKSTKSTNSKRLTKNI